ncbi:uncharacterized protein BDR25DRAFT_310783 [Lindgomyces ingoldianus]|uniref:Uncharacterized protein n=1 Tax=Lindgomyces ingoldianus TaxID=673940 RepID=A0ACB6R825_9PLEO|nr:uncharacterized protein BDR25DRAFT_310783 [Lindgomyces ingoldianus]KAF2475404.1 hypothetical protein BDR25DRAFT_310783 [Lindgomyces ingoldianus]
MAMFLDTCCVPQSHHPLQIIHYDGRPKPKRPSQRTSPKIRFGEDGTGSNAEQENEEDPIPTSDEVELADLACLADNEANYEVSGRRGENGDVGNDDPTNEREGVSMPASQEDTGDKASRNAVIINDSLHMGDRLESPSTSTPEYRDTEVPTGTTDTINLETVNRAKIQANKPPHGRLPSTPPTSPSITNIEQLTEEAFRCIHMKATAHQRPTETRLPTIESTSSGSSSGSDTDDDDHNGKHTTSLTRKRKRSPPANNASHKRQSREPNTTLKPSTTCTKPSARRQNLSLPQEKAVSNHVSDARLASAAQSSVCDTKMCCGKDSSAESSEGSGEWGRHLRKGRKPMGSNQGSVWCSRLNAKNPSSTPAPLHANRKTRLSAKGVSPGQIQWHLLDIAFHSLSAYVSFLIAIFRAYSGPGMISTSHAVTLLKSIWCSGCGIGQPLLAPSSLPLNRADTASPRDYGRPRDAVVDDDDQSAYEDYDKKGKNDEEYLSDVVKKLSSSRTHPLVREGRQQIAQLGKARQVLELDM